MLQEQLAIPSRKKWTYPYITHTQWGERLHINNTIMILYCAIDLYEDKILHSRLGEAVDGTNLNLLGTIRKPGKNNIWTINRNETTEQTDIITSHVEFTTKAKSFVDLSSVSGGISLNISAEILHSRNKIKYTEIKCKRITTREVYFHDYHSKEYYRKDDSDSADSDFEKQLCEFLNLRISKIADQAEDTLEEKVESFLCKHYEASPSKVEFYNALDIVLEFVKIKSSTHYIDSITFGAESNFTTHSKKSKCKTKVSAGFQPHFSPLGGAMDSTITMSTSRESSYKNDKGDIDDVKCGKGEAVISYKLKPMYLLICKRHKMIRGMLHYAIHHYLGKLICSYIE